MLGEDDCQCLIVGQLDLVLPLVLALELLQVVERCYRQGEVAEDTFLILHKILSTNEKGHLRSTGDGLLGYKGMAGAITMVCKKSQKPQNRHLASGCAFGLLS